MSTRAKHESELALLRESARRFAKRHKRASALLEERASDPDVERLFDAFAFCAARIGEKIDDVAPEIIHKLAELLLPQLLRPLPAATIVEFSPNMSALRKPHEIKREKILLAEPRGAHGTRCKFRTCFDVTLLPLEVVRVDLDERRSDRPALRLKLRTTEGGKKTLLKVDSIRFFVHGEPTTSGTIVLWLLRHCRELALRLGGAQGPATSLDPAASLRLFAAGDDASMLPWPETAATGYRYLLEYFMLPEKFQFIELSGLKGRLADESDSCELELCFTFDRPLPTPTTITKDNFRLFCTPAVNLFKVSAEPVRRTPLAPEHLVRADGIAPADMEVYDILGVRSMSQGDTVRKEYAPFVRFGQFGWSSKSCFSLRREDSIDGGVDTYISFGEPRNVAPSLVEENVSIDLLCTNRQLPLELKTQSINHKTRGGMYRQFINIVPISPPARVSSNSDLLWCFVSHLGLNTAGVSESRHLRDLLHLYNPFSRDSEHGSLKYERIMSIRELERESVTRLVKGVPVRGVRTSVTLDESKFDSVGLAFLFSWVLNELFASQVSLNSFNELVVKMFPSNARLLWSARTGGRR